MSEPLYTVDNYHDRPVTGIAGFNGKPHRYERQFSEAEDEYTDVYWLTEVSDLVLTLALEREAIFDRWREAHKSGDVTLDTHPALPPERARYDELKAKLKALMPSRSPDAISMRATFITDPGAWQIEWSSP